MLVDHGVECEVQHLILKVGYGLAEQSFGIYLISIGRK